jgi:hypothetical protein
MNQLSFSIPFAKKFVKRWLIEYKLGTSSEERVAHYLDLSATDVRLIADELRQWLKANGSDKVLPQLREK